MLFSPCMYAMPVGQTRRGCDHRRWGAFLSLSCSAGLADDGKFLLAARKCRRPACTEYLISLDAKNTSAGSYIGKLR
ncbi:Tubby-like F-box protein 3 [Zea mays]|uniref:Tubby-like F-box protein 3 n=1 Tax=Zea mays TaxID=4577 RepID=A0A1D6K2H8_MAIZE|nr:Tubby-like F-box protein 3 [Zea mays]ONL97890.1 Tubby-like F-box protein 3 [Zea mays]